jgi:hypothetical protein
MYTASVDRLTVDWQLVAMLAGAAVYWGALISLQLWGLELRARNRDLRWAIHRRLEALRLRELEAEQAD